MMTNADVASYIINISKPLNVIFIESFGKLRIMRTFHPFIQSFFLMLLIMVVGIPWVVTGIMNGPNQPLTYILGFIAVANAVYSSLIGTYIIYRRAKVRLAEIVQNLNIKLPPLDLQKWEEIFSIHNQFRTSIVVALFGALLVGLTSIISDKANPLTIASATFGGYIMGFIIGSGIHIFVNFPSTATRFYLVNILKIYKLAPVETSGLAYLFSITVDFMLVGSSVGTFALFTLLLYLANTNLYFSKIAYLPAIIASIFIVIVALIMLIRSIIIFANQIRKEKLNVLSELQNLINKKYYELDKDKGKSETYDKIEKLIKVYNGIKSSSLWPFEAEVARNALASIFVPFIPVIIQIAIDWVIH